MTTFLQIGKFTFCVHSTLERWSRIYDYAFAFDFFIVTYLNKQSRTDKESKKTLFTYASYTFPMSVR